MISQAYKDNYANIDFSKPLKVAPRKPQLRGPRSDLAAPMIVGDYESYECPVSGKMIEGRSAHRENLRQTGCRILEPGETEKVKREGKDFKNSLTDAAVDKAFDNAVKELY